MRIALVYVGVIVIWSTTPLAIKWSGEEGGYLFGASARMVIGMCCLLVVCIFASPSLRWCGTALKTYLAVALQIYGAMSLTYWGAQFIPSGWISVIFGLTPLITAILAAVILREHSLSPGKLLSYLLGVAGLIVMFASAWRMGKQALYGSSAVFLAASLQSLSAVWIKQINARLPALMQVTGGLLVALPLYGISCAAQDIDWPQQISIVGWASIVYLGLVATAFGFLLYYYLLLQLTATRVAMITLITPVISLAIGRLINHEPLNLKVAVGAFFIMVALVLHDWLDCLINRRLKLFIKA
jgi:drug/metabolite transporter (DMT)-like permease